MSRRWLPAVIACGLLGAGLPTAPALASGSRAVVAPVSAQADAGTNLQGLGSHSWTTTTLSGAQTPAPLGGIDYLVPQGVDGPLPVVTMVAGFSDTRQSVRWLAERLASHGLLVQLVDSVTPIDPPTARARALVSAQDFLLTGSPVRTLVDPSRTALWGYSMGGGGALEAAQQLPGLDAVVAVFPWDASPRFPRITAPTLVVSGERDAVAVPAWYADPAYASLTMPDRAYAMVAQASHPLPSHSTDPRLTELSVAWLVDHLVGSPAAHAWRCPGPQVGVPVAGTAGYAQWRATCP
ncbi:hypothetical protein [Luteococcus peritonei]|uniref:Dienelactone hydrolase family protein n=1 Tax=Luteococcus peritonei TaxID=88874 RepID=A0ABW4RUN6_9ACTN